MTTFTKSFFGEEAKKLIAMGAFGDFRVDGMVFSLQTRSVEGRDVVDLTIAEESGKRQEHPYRGSR